MGTSSSEAASSHLVEVLLEREDRLRQEAKEERAAQEAKLDALRTELEAKAQAEREELRHEMAELRAEMKPVAAISEQQIAALQARLEAAHAAQLLTDEELFTLEDLIADWVTSLFSPMCSTRLHQTNLGSL
jgi:hypothetical protein